MRNGKVGKVGGGNANSLDIRSIRQVVAEVVAVSVEFDTRNCNNSRAMPSKTKTTRSQGGFHYSYLHGGACIPMPKAALAMRPCTKVLKFANSPIDHIREERWMK